jgi:MYXO-CTERM domain-containing protein
MRRSAAVALLAFVLLLSGPTSSALACHKPGHQDTPGQACNSVPESPLGGYVYPAAGVASFALFLLVQRRRRLVLQRADV